MSEKQLAYAIDEITEIATDFGLDFFPMRYEICPAHILYTFGAYGMPTRYRHWSFGKQFHKMKLQYDIGLSKIYELVINANPCYAFLLDTNSLVQNKLIIAHVLAHSDFFKNNIHFHHTRKDMVESMEATADRIEIYAYRYGRAVVEHFIDAVLSIQEHIEPSPFIEQQRALKSPYQEKASKKNQSNDGCNTSIQETTPSKDLLLFIEQYSRNLKPWQRDVLTMLREEMLYFWPQLETKIMNEGWASFWHQKIMRKLPLSSAETIEFASLNASVLQPSKSSLNPYAVGLKIFQDIEKRAQFERGATHESGIQKIFEVRSLHSDSSFIRNYLTKEVVEKEDLYLYKKQQNQYEVTTKSFEKIKEEMIRSRLNGGFPYLVVTSGDYLLNGELYIEHRYEGVELDIPYLEHVLPHIYTLWGRIVHVETIIKHRRVVFTYDGYKISQQSVSRT